MIKKIIGLLFLPYLTFMFLESCWDNQCDRRETRNITNIKMSHLEDPTTNRENLILKMDYESYFVNNYRPNLLGKAYARSYVQDFCFEGFSNPIEKISIISTNDFDSDHLSGSEINSLFNHNNSNNKLDDYDFDSSSFDDFGVDGQMIIYNDSIPTLDSIHTLYFNIYCADGKTYLDTLDNVNLNRTINWYYY